MLYLRKALVIISQREREKKKSHDGGGYCRREDATCCLFFFFFSRFLRLRAAKKLMKVARARGDGSTTLSGDKVIRAGNNERERKS